MHTRSSRFLYIFTRHSRSPIATCSFTLWMVLKDGPNSITSAPAADKKRPSLVPPLVEVLPIAPVTSFKLASACLTRSLSASVLYGDEI